MQTAQKVAIIVGSSGQDGTLLTKELLLDGYTVFGLTRTDVLRFKGKKTERMGSFGLLDKQGIHELVKTCSSQEIYYLAAHHGSSEANTTVIDPEEYEAHHRVHVSGLLNFLTAIKNTNSSARLFYASSSLVFDGSNGPVQDETTPYSPRGYYGLTKMQGMHLCREFRDVHKVFASCGILYNHESVLRSDGFLSKKLLASAHEIANGNRSELRLGNLNAETDWGYAPDFVKAFQKILQVEKPDDFIIATGKSHTVREFADLVFEGFGLDASKHVTEDPSVLIRNPKRKIGNCQHLTETTGWKPGRSFKEMVGQLVNDYKSLKASTSKAQPQ